MSDATPVFKVTDYALAAGAEQVREMIDEGYQPHGSAILVDGSIYQPMVQKELISAKEYADLMLTVLEATVLMKEKMDDLGML